MSAKTEQFIAYLAKNNDRASITVLMKLAYLIDLVALKKLGQQISDFHYRRYNYGPFDQSIYSAVNGLTEKAVLVGKSEYTQHADEYIVYSFNEETEFNFDAITNPERKIIDEVLETVKGYGAKALTDIAYKTKPMLALGATLGGDENMGVLLDLSAR